MEKNTTPDTNRQRTEEERAEYRKSLEAERERMREGCHDYPFQGCTEAELSDWWDEYHAEFGKNAN
jgi:hypothetical protein